MNAESTYAFYGSLRRGMINFQHYRHGLKFQYAERIPFYCLYPMENYPYAVRTGSKDDTIVVEVFKITDPKVEKAIHDLEISVGYFYNEIEIRGQSVGIYLFEIAGPEPSVKGGDWVKFFGS